MSYAVILSQRTFEGRGGGKSSNSRELGEPIKKKKNGFQVQIWVKKRGQTA